MRAGVSVHIRSYCNWGWEGLGVAVGGGGGGTEKKLKKRGGRN